MSPHFSMERDRPGRSLRRPAEEFLTQEVKVSSTGQQDRIRLRSDTPLVVGTEPGHRVLPYNALVGCACLVLLMACGAEPQTRVLETAKTLESARSEVWDGKVLTVSIPEGWVPEPVFGMRDESFRVVGTSGMEAEVTVTALPVTGGTVESNVARWANQAGVEKPDSRPVVVGELKGVAVDFFPGPDQQAKPAILGAILEDGEKRRFIKFSGPPVVVEAHRDRWEGFLSSIQWKDRRS